MMTINAERLLRDLYTLRSFGGQSSGKGVVRPALSVADLEARRWLAARMAEAGLDARIDGVGNVLGRSRNPGPALLLGSHSDTQPRGGWLDGALGVIYALEAVRACAEHADTRDLALDAVSWIDEEGAYLSCLGSRAFCGQIEVGEIEGARGRDGKPLVEALRAAGLDGVAVRPGPGRYRGYLEAHIEQGPYLEARGLKLGVVTDIVGSRNFDIVFKGQQNHAGTTPMALRKDAGRALIDCAYHIDQAFQELAGPRTVWTIGRVEFDPGAPSIIPGRAEMRLQFRDTESARLDGFEAKARELVAAANRHGPVAVTMTAAGKPSVPTAMDEDFQRHLAAAAEAHAPGRWQSMPSGAIHDAMHLARVMPAAMLFIPSIGGVSHDFSEDSVEDDIVLGCRAFADAAGAILGAAQIAK